MDVEMQTKLALYLKLNQDWRMELEEIVLGAILIEDHCLVKVVDLLGAINFTGFHKDVWLAVLTLFDAADPVDIKTVYHQLRHHAEITPYMVAMLTSKINSSANIEAHALKLIECSIIDRFIRMYLRYINDSKVSALGQDIIQGFMTGDNSLAVLDDACTWILSHLPHDHEFAIELYKFNQSIKLKTERINERSRIKTMVRQLECLATGRNRPEIQATTSLLLLAINQPTLPPTFFNQIQKLKNSLL